MKKDKKQNDHFEVSNGQDSYYANAQNEYYEQNSDLVKRLHNTKRREMMAWALAVFMGVGVMFMASKQVVVPVVVEMDSFGEVRAVTTGKRDLKYTNGVVLHQLESWISKARSVATDTAIQKNWLLNVYNMTSGAGRKYLDNFYSERTPMKYVEENKASILVEDVRIYKKGDKADGVSNYSMTWVEAKRPIMGGAVTKRAYEAYITTATKQLNSEIEIRKNPTGTYITQIDWHEIKYTGDRK